MPPPGGKHPKPEQVTDSSRRSRRASTRRRLRKESLPGSVVMHRLNRVEYPTAIRDLLGVDIDASRLLPADVTSDGFDNVAEVLRVSPTYLDQYIAAAREISIKAVGNPTPEPARAEYLIEERRITPCTSTGLPLGTRDGVVVEHYFPADGEYVFNLNVSSEPGAELRAYPQGWLEYRAHGDSHDRRREGVRSELGGEKDLRDVDHFQIAAVERDQGSFP